MKCDWSGPLDLVHRLALLLHSAAEVSIPVRKLFVRSAALWLLALTIVLSTAPLSTRELSDLLQGTTASGLVPRSRAPRDVSLAHAALVHALPVVRETATDKHQAASVGVTTALAFSPAGARVDRRPNTDNLLVPRPIAKTILRI